MASTLGVVVQPVSPTKTSARSRLLPPGNSTGTLYFLHTDHLGSTSLTTNMSQAIGQQRHYAYGEPRNGAGTLPTDRAFTGQVRDATGLDYFRARYFSSSLGRFISADSIVPGAGNPQALNRYSYTFGNPMRYNDPSGHDRDCGIGMGCISPSQPPNKSKTTTITLPQIKFNPASLGPSDWWTVGIV